MQIKAERISGMKPKRFSAEGWLHYNVRIFLDSTDGPPLSEVEMVVYILDPSFGDNRYRVSVDRSQRFQIEIWTYDFFDVSARILMKSTATTGAYQTVTGEVRWEGRVEAREYA